MDGSHLGGSSHQLAKDQLLPLQPLAPLHHHHHHNPLASASTSASQLLSQSRTGSVLLLRTSRSPSATRSAEPTS